MEAIIRLGTFFGEFRVAAPGGPHAPARAIAGGPGSRRA